MASSQPLADDEVSVVLDMPMTTLDEEHSDLSIFHNDAKETLLEEDPEDASPCLRWDNVTQGLTPRVFQLGDSMSITLGLGSRQQHELISGSNWDDFRWFEHDVVTVKQSRDEHRLVEHEDISSKWKERISNLDHIRTVEGNF